MCVPHYYSFSGSKPLCLTVPCTADVMLMQSHVPGMWEGNGNRGLFLSQEAARGAAPLVWQRLLLNSVQKSKGGDFNFHT